MTPNTTTITKETNGNVLVESEGGDYTLLAGSYLTKESDGVKVRGKDAKVLDDFKVSVVKEVVREDGTVVVINDVATLFSELNTYFFFELTGGGGAGSMLSTEITQTLNAGDNNLAHNLGKTVIAFTVRDGDLFVATTGNIVDTNNFNINLAAGSIANAKITLIYLN